MIIGEDDIFSTKGKRLRFIRSQLGLTQKGLGQMLGLAWYQVKNMERSTVNISRSMAKLIYYETGYNTDWLLEGKGEMKNISLEKGDVNCINLIDRIIDRTIARTGIQVETEERQFIKSITQKDLINDLAKITCKAETRMLEFLKLMKKASDYGLSS